MGYAPTSRRQVRCHKPWQVFTHLQGLGSSQLADHLVNEVNQGPCYVKSKPYFQGIPNTSVCITLVISLQSSAIQLTGKGGLNITKQIRSPSQQTFCKKEESSERNVCLVFRFPFNPQQISNPKEHTHVGLDNTCTEVLWHQAMCDVFKIYEQDEFSYFQLPTILYLSGTGNSNSAISHSKQNIHK